MKVRGHKFKADAQGANGLLPGAVRLVSKGFFEDTVIFSPGNFCAADLSKGPPDPWPATTLKNAATKLIYMS
jgi:hypothetical protein